MDDLGVWRDSRPEEKAFTLLYSAVHKVYSTIDYFFFFFYCASGTADISDHNTINLEDLRRDTQWTLNIGILNKNNSAINKEGNSRVH